MSSLKAVLYGLGPIGALIGKVAYLKGFEIAGGIDIDPGKVGKDLGELIGLGEKLGVHVSSDPEEVLSRTRPDIVFHATVSYLDRAYPQIVKAMKYGANVISTCETLAYPYYRYPELAELIDAYAKKAGVTVLGTGINPGFILDLLPAILTIPLMRVQRIRAVRSLDAGRRRYSFQRKIGLGLHPDDWKRRLESGDISGHVGYAESVLLIASMLGVNIERVEEAQEPIIAERDYRTEYFHISPGSVRGLKGYGIGYLKGKEFIRVELIAAAGAEDYEEIVLEGEPRITWRSSGTPGDIATAAVVVNLAPQVVEAEPGLITIRDLRVAACYRPL